MHWTKWCSSHIYFYEKKYKNLFQHSSVVEQRPFKPKIWVLIPCAPILLFLLGLCLIGLNLQKVLYINCPCFLGQLPSGTSTLFPFNIIVALWFCVFLISVNVTPFYNRSISFLHLAIKYKNYAIMSGSTHLNKRPHRLFS